MHSKFSDFESHIVKLYLFRRRTIADIQEFLRTQGVTASKAGIWHFIRPRKAGWAEKASELWDRADRRGSTTKVPAVSRERGVGQDEPGSREKKGSHFENLMAFGVKADELEER